MIYALAKRPAETGQHIIICLDDRDIALMKGDRYLFVTPEHLKRQTFGEITIIHKPTRKEAIQLLGVGTGVGPQDTERLHAQPPLKDDERECIGCQARVHFTRLYEDRCICCWAGRAKDLVDFINGGDQPFGEVKLW